MFSCFKPVATDERAAQQAREAVVQRFAEQMHDHAATLVEKHKVHTALHCVGTFQCRSAAAAARRAAESKGRMTAAVEGSDGAEENSEESNGGNDSAQ